MGLPLFVAPVESDVPSQIGDKSESTRHARSSIRRARRNLDSRPFRRRAALLRDNFPTPGPEPVPRARYPWIESGHLPPPEAYTAAPTRTMPPAEPDRGAPTPESTELRDALREMRSRAAERGPEASEARLISLFGERWAFENSPQPSRSNATPPAGEEQPSWQEPERPQVDGIALYPYLSSSRRFRRAQLDRMSMPAPPVAARFDRSPEHSVSARFSGRRPRVEARTLPPTLHHRIRRIRPSGQSNESSLTDGLGDRDRSLSPDEDGVWDTLLTTLTPDPQPPSAGSSFASASASASASTSQSQSAAASSRTSLTGPEMAEEALEQPCESGLDNSDDEGQEDLRMGRGWPDHWTMNYPSRHRRFVADLDANDPSRLSYMRDDSSYRRTDRTPAARNAQDDEEMRTRRRLELLRHYRIATRDPTPLPELLGHIVRDSSEEAGGTGGQGDSNGDDEETPSSYNNTSNDNALHGMQMIVRNLARREDIPDEWWAGAGLSRTLPEES
ncbi:hypothetical protein LZ30DRAFT_212168 [Colletotrichum cereale]|nr:hypothetical protein LZ30DRAFT_212168 [Colletotrichum cereale]